MKEWKWYKFADAFNRGTAEEKREKRHNWIMGARRGIRYSAVWISRGRTVEELIWLSMALGVDKSISVFDVLECAKFPIRDPQVMQVTEAMISRVLTLYGVQMQWESEIERSRLPHKAGVYFLWREGQLDYIGQSVDLRSRFSRQHNHYVEGEHYVTWVLLDDDVARCGCEVALISLLRPKQNINWCTRVP